MLKFAFKTFAAAFAALLCASLFAETKTEGGYTLRLKAVKDGSEYKIGDTAQFALYITKDGKPVDGIDVRSEITKDTVNMGNTSQGKTKKGVFRASGKLSEAGFLKCRMRAEIPLADGKKKAVDMLAGAAFEPLKIKPSLPAPDDFDAYWAKQKKILAAIPANAKATFVKSVGGIKVFDIQADTFNGKLSGYLAYPENAEKGTLPAIITTHGWGVRGSSFNGVVAWAKRGFLAFDFNANGLPNGKPAQFYKDLKAGALKNYHIGDWKDRDGLFFRTLFMRDMRAITLLSPSRSETAKTSSFAAEARAAGRRSPWAAWTPACRLSLRAIPRYATTAAPSRAELRAGPTTQSSTKTATTTKSPLNPPAM